MHNDRNVMERHHVATAIRVAEDLELFADIAPDMYKEVGGGG